MAKILLIENGNTELCGHNKNRTCWHSKAEEVCDRNSFCHELIPYWCPLDSVPVEDLGLSTEDMLSIPDASGDMPPQDLLDQSFEELLAYSQPPDPKLTALATELVRGVDVPDAPEDKDFEDVEPTTGTLAFCSREVLTKKGVGDD